MKIWNNPSLSPDERVDALIAEMSVEDKTHQLGSFWLRPNQDEASVSDNLSTNHEVAPMENAFKTESLTWDEATTSGLGHLTRVWGSEPLDINEGAERLKTLQTDIQSRNAFGIPALVHEECLTGFTAYRATVYPAAIAWGATWNPATIEIMARQIGADLAALGVHQGLSPLLDVVRDYRWGRVEETCGEDPYLVGCIGTAYVRGLQGSGVDATLKHFVGYPASRGGRNHAPVSMGPRELEDVMLPPFEMAVREGHVHSVMNSYADIDGIPAIASKHLLTDVLRQRWGFQGVTVSDYWSIRFLENMHRTASNSREAGAVAFNAGMDVELPETTCYHYLAQAVREGLVSSDTLDAAVRRVLLQKLRHGLLDHDWEPSVDTSRDLDSSKNREIARAVANESVILLANDGILPIQGPQRVAVIGPVWTEVRSFMGCYAFPNHVLPRFDDKGTGLDIRSLPDALADIDDTEMIFARGTGFTTGTDQEILEAVDAARESDMVIMTLGDIAGMFGEGTSGEGCDVASLDLPGRQGELLDAILDTGTPIVLVLVTGRPYAIGKYENRCAAILQAFMPGVEGADAIAGVLSGSINPSGRLPIAIPNEPGGQPGTYLAPPLAWESEGISNIDPRPRFPFGYGLSYTTYEYSDAEVSTIWMPLDGTVSYSVTVANTGDRAGAEVVQLYAADPVGEVVRPLKTLIGFVKIPLEAGQRARVTFTVHADRFSFTGVDLQRIVEGGVIELSAGASSEDRVPPISIELEAGRRFVGEGQVLTTPVHVEFL